jgi:hypothetical protein
LEPDQEQETKLSLKLGQRQLKKLKDAGYFGTADLLPFTFVCDSSIHQVCLKLIMIIYKALHWGFSAAERGEREGG